MEEYVYIDGKKYRRGYTTGSCATAASKAAAMMLLLQKEVTHIQIDTPKGITLNLKVQQAVYTKDYAECAIQKDGGDDIDATHGMLIFSRVTRAEEKGVHIDGGTGIGRVTLKGLGLPIGAAAINKTPLAMIEKEVSKVVGEEGVNVLIWAPEGEQITQKTFNPKLGIIGGISIIGTSGIVEPMSDEGWKRSLSLELEMKRVRGLESIILVPGNHGERFVKEVLGIDEVYVVKMSNFIGYMLLECKRLGYKNILLIGHLGKFVKLAGGIFQTHSKVADARNEVMIAYLALMGAQQEVLEQVNECKTTEAALEIIETAGLTEIYNILANRCEVRCNQHIQDESIMTGTILFSMAGDELGRSESTNKLLEVYR